MFPSSLGKHLSARLHKCNLLGGGVGDDKLTLPTWFTTDSDLPCLLLLTLQRLPVGASPASLPMSTGAQILLLELCLSETLSSSIAHSPAMSHSHQLYCTLTTCIAHLPAVVHSLDACHRYPLCCIPPEVHNQPSVALSPNCNPGL